MKLVKFFFIIVTIFVIGSGYGQSYIYLSHNVLTTPLICEFESKSEILNNGAIDSIVTRSSMELNTESPFTFVYLHSGKWVEFVGECIYSSKQAESPFCILDPPCCGGNTFEYHWMRYNHSLDTIEQICKIVMFITTEIHREDIVWHATPQEKESQYIQLRSEPIVNDTEEDWDLRQTGNVIYNDMPLDLLFFELGYLEKQSEWRLCAVQIVKNKFRIGWMQTENIQSKQ